ncbi:MAG: hypothetical protein GTN40_05300 [Candidatus Aenigmarchaeota archaeon]|nr:hypothetical protein [Candidatus Aenigmarchaeota archaeon]
MSTIIPVEKNGKVEMESRPLRQYQVELSTEKGYLMVNCPCGGIKRINPKAYMLEGKLMESVREEKHTCGRKFQTYVKMVNGRPDIRVAVTKHHIPLRLFDLNFGMEEIQGGVEFKIDNNGSDTQIPQGPVKLS